MKDMVVRFLREDERKRVYEFAASLADRDFWGKKGRFLRGGFERFQSFFEYIKPFQPKCFLVAEEDNKLVGFVVAVYNQVWIDELRERYGCNVHKLAYILGVAAAQNRTDVLKRLTNKLTDYFSKKGIKRIEYPTLGNVCLTTATDVITSENVDALIIFREAGFKISECYYSMKLNLNSYQPNKEYPIKEGSFRFQERSLEIVRENDILGKITWDLIKNGKTSINIEVSRAFREKGLGTALLTEALRVLKSEGVKMVELGVDGNNLPALRLYRKFGFEAYKTHFYISVQC